MDAALQQRLDLPRLMQNLGRKETVERMLDLYLSTTKKSFLELEKAERTHDITAWRSLAHSLKGAAQNITAKRIVNLCLEAEEITELPDERAKATIYHLYKELGILRETVEKSFGGKSSLL